MRKHDVRSAATQMPTPRRAYASTLAMKHSHAVGLRTACDTHTRRRGNGIMKGKLIDTLLGGFAIAAIFFALIAAPAWADDGGALSGEDCPTAGGECTRKSSLDGCINFDCPAWPANCWCANGLALSCKCYASASGG